MRILNNLYAVDLGLEPEGIMTFAVTFPDADYPEPTDVISFSLGDGDELLGDIYVGLPQARRQAEDFGVALDEELVRLAIHGSLHVLGYDHPDGPEREGCAMYALQEAYLKSILAEGAGYPE